MKEERKLYEEIQELTNERENLIRQEENEPDRDKSYEMFCKERDLTKSIKEKQTMLDIIKILKED